MIQSYRPRLLFTHLAVKLGSNLIISDLHLGIDSELSISNPSSAELMLAQLKPLSKLGDRLIILGDIKHSLHTIDVDVWGFFHKATELFGRIDLIKGNHDGRIQKILKEFNSVYLHGSSGFKHGENFFFHGHAYPKPEAYSCRNIFMGHLHPIANSPGTSEKAFMVCEPEKFSEDFFQKKKIPVPANKCPKIIVLPSFNPLVKGRRNSFTTSKILTNVFKEIVVNVYSSDGIS